MKISFEMFKQKFSEVIEDDSIISFDADFDFRELQSWDSLSEMSLIAMIDNEFGLTIKSDEILSTKSLQELYILIVSKK